MLISVVVPCRNEAESLPRLVSDIEGALAGRDYEIIAVDDGSTDGTWAVLEGLKSNCERVRVVVHDRSAGQSAAVYSGLLAARGELVATLDGDGQNDPAYLPELTDLLVSAGPDAGMAAGQRTRRTDALLKRLSSGIANGLRRAILHDGAIDSACGMKVLYRDLFLVLPYFDGWHRFLPALVRREGRQVVFLNVIDRPRLHGRSKYGILDRGWRGIIDLIGVWWLQRRRRILPVATEKDV